jgi:hypothetical protein
MILDFEEFEIKMLEMIAITNENIKKEKEYLIELKKQCCDYFTVGEENPHNIIPVVQTTIKCLEEQIKTYETAIDVAKSLTY